MTPLRAILRVRDGGLAQVLHVSVDQELAPMAEHLVQRAQRQASQALQPAGVYRLEISGQPQAPEIATARLAGPQDSIIVAELVRSRDGSLAVQDLVFSKGQDATVSARQFMDVLGQSIARQATALDGRERATLEIVLSAART